MKIYRFEKYDVADRISLTEQGILDKRIGQLYKIGNVEEYAVVERILRENRVGSLVESEAQKNGRVKEILEILVDADIISFRSPFRQKNIYAQKTALLLGKLFLYIFLIYHLAFTPFFVCSILMKMPIVQTFFYCEAIILLIFLHECCHFVTYKMLCKNSNVFFSLSFFRIELVTAPIDSRKSFLIAISGAVGSCFVCGLGLLVHFNLLLLLAIILNGLMLLPIFDDGKNMINALRKMKRN